MIYAVPRILHFSYILFKWSALLSDESVINISKMHSIALLWSFPKFTASSCDSCYTKTEPILCFSHRTHIYWNFSPKTISEFHMRSLAFSLSRSLHVRESFSRISHTSKKADPRKSPPSLHLFATRFTWKHKRNRVSNAHYCAKRTQVHTVCGKARPRYRCFERAG